MTGPDVATHAKVSYRRIDYWIRCGYISAESAGTGGRDSKPRDPTSPGSGSVRNFTATEAEIARRMASLIRVGMRAEVAAVAGREWVLGGRDGVHLGEGLVIQLDPTGQEVSA